MSRKPASPPVSADEVLSAGPGETTAPPDPAEFKFKTWTDFLIALGVNVAAIEAQLLAYKTAHPDATGAVTLAERLLADNLGSDTLTVLASQAASALAASALAGHGEVDKQPHPTDFA